MLVSLRLFATEYMLCLTSILYFLLLFSWCTTLQDVPEEYSNHKVNRGFTNYNTLLGPKRWPAQLPAPIYDGWLCNHKGEWLFRRTYFGDEVTDGSAPQPQNKSLYRMVHLPSILPEPVWSEELYKLPF